MTYSLNNNYSVKNATHNQSYGAKSSYSAKGGYPRNVESVERESSLQSGRVDSAKARVFSHAKDQKPAYPLPKKKFTHSKANPISIAINKKICQTRSYFEILRIWNESKAEFNEVNIATAIHRLTKSQDKFEFSRLQDDAKSLLDELINAARQSVSKFTSQGLSNILWALATLGIKDRIFHDFANDIEKRNLTSFKPQDFANILWAFATLGIKDEKLFQEFANEIEKRNKTSFTPQAIANILWAFAILNIKDKRLFESFAKEIENRNLKEFKVQTISTILWACAVTKAFPLDLIKRLFKELPELIERDTIALQEATQLLHVRLALMFELPNEHIPCSKKLLAQMRAAKERLPHTQKKVSSLLHLAVADVLSKMKVNFEKEKYVDILSCDLVQDHLVIEVNGPNHYPADLKCLNGESLLKLRLLNKLGYTTIVIPYWEWNTLETVELQENYLINRLEQIAPYKSPVTALSLEDGIVDV
jgi:hypothetical protein